MSLLSIGSVTTDRRARRRLIFLRRIRHVVSIVTLLLTGSSGALAQSQQTPDRPAQPTQQETATQVEQRVPAPVVPPPAPLITQQITQESGSSNEQGLPLIVSAVATAVFTGLMWGVARRQANIADFQATIARAQKRIGDRQLEISKKQQATLEDTLATNKAIERAYIDPFVPPPGLQFFGLDDDNVLVTVHMVVKNRGRTPGRVTDSAIQLTIRPAGELPPPPVRPEGQSVLKAFLVTDAEMAIGDRITITDADQVAIRETETKKLYAVGFVDYIDKFGEHHRAGIAQVYSKDHDKLMHATNVGTKAGINLTFLDLDGSGYKYDRPRTKGEGNDWD